MSKTYHIIQSSIAERVENKVNEMMEEGWTPSGGLNVFHSGWRLGFVYTQAMVLPTPAEGGKE